MTEIIRKDSNNRLSRIVVHGDTVHVAGVTSRIGSDITSQTKDVLAKIDQYLAAAGTDKRRLLTAQIWLRDIERDFEGMNAAWAAWADPAALPTRATCEAKLAAPDLLVEIIVSAASKGG